MGKQLLVGVLSTLLAVVILDWYKARGGFR